ncbi:response regulator [Paraglaciecola agarilytica]|uniref:ATP-binding response regulator n=1 Tax=Paraglaciecola chathamensis TaxID=368405 RepID=UPI001C0953C8|nr:MULTISPECIES: ATP-binding protein [Paraglaciecola]MBU3017415.1 response regulator [Paraglaciecola agarilytica]MDO6561327.1 ATP-binding protein [Paraglaciecola chathamensis]MDO6839890.1 ATP-binding protein [Paraglaciecola chathamensis]
MKILLVEDNPDHSELIQDSCHEAFSLNCSITVHSTLVAGLSALAADTYDIAFVDLSLPDSNIAATTEALRELQTAVPIIVLTSLNDEEVGRQLIKNGAQDFLPKDNLNTTLLQRMTTYAIERKHYQVQLENHAFNQQTFCRSLSHDFKAPIRNIGQLTSMLKEQLLERNVLENENRSLFDKIDGRLEKMNRLVDGLYHYILTEQQLVTDGFVDLNQTMLELEQLLTSNNQKTVTIHFEKLPTINGDNTQIFLLLQNILENAIKYCEVDPIITVSSEKVQNDYASNTHHAHKIHVRDNGIGIEEHFIQEIFEPFRRLHPEYQHQGTGLGLSVVKRIVDNHKGKISVQSTLGKGTCFTLIFPHTEAQ